MPTADGLAPVEKAGKWGYIDSTGAVVIPPSWKYPGTFENGIAKVGQGIQCGYIDKTGKLLGQRMWTAGRPFADGMACVSKDGKWGYIDQTGTLVIQPCSDVGDDFIHGLAIVRQGDKLGLIDKTGKFVVAVEWDGIESDRYDSLGYRLLIKMTAADKALAVWRDPDLKEIWRAELPLEGDNSGRAPVSDAQHREIVQTLPKHDNTETVSRNETQKATAANQQGPTNSKSVTTMQFMGTIMDSPFQQNITARFGRPSSEKPGAGGILEWQYICSDGFVNLEFQNGVLKNMNAIAPTK